MTNNAQPRNIQDLIKSGDVAPIEKMLSQEEKQQLASVGTVFTVTDIKIGSDEKYGGFYEMHAFADELVFTTRFAEGTRRDDFLQQLMVALGGGPIAGLRLVAYPGQGGNQFINVEPA